VKRVSRAVLARLIAAVFGLSLVIAALGILLSGNFGPGDFLAVWGTSLAAVVAVTAWLVYRFAPDHLEAAVSWTVDTVFGFGEPRTGPAGLIGATAVLTRPFVATAEDGPRGKVRLRGETWNARWTGDDPPPAAPGTEVRVEAVDGLLLDVGPAPSQSSSRTSVISL
jgi:membrane protein implicated in regulation of membrane protease activity